MDKNSKFYKMRQKYLSHPLQGLGAHILYWFFAAMPIDMASNFAGCLMRNLGPKMGQTKKARNNLTRAFPEKSKDEIEEIVADMWENLGRSAGEIPHLHKLHPAAPASKLSASSTDWHRAMTGNRDYSLPVISATGKSACASQPSLGWI